MEHSNPVPMTRALMSVSPVSASLAAANGNCLEIFDVATMSLLHSITTADILTAITWGQSSTGSELVAAASERCNCVVVVEAETGTVVADLHDSPIAISGIALSKRGQLFVASEHGLGLSIYSVESAVVLAVLPFVKEMPGTSYYSWSPCGQFIAVAIRKDATDGICVLSLDTGHVMMSVSGAPKLAGISNLAGLKWLPEGRGILIWGGPADMLNCGAVAVISLSGIVTARGNDGMRDIAWMQDSESDINNNAAFVAALQEGVPCTGLGIKCVTVNANGSMIAIGGYDGNLRIINTTRWSLATSFGHTKPKINEQVPPVIFRERTKLIPLARSVDEDENSSVQNNYQQIDNCNSRSVGRKKDRSGACDRTSYFEIRDSKEEIEITKRVRSVCAPGSTPFGVGTATFSSDGSYVASRSDRSSNVVFIWNVKDLQLSAVLILEEDVRCLRWSKRKGSCEESEHRTGEEDEVQLAIATGGEHVYLWKRTGAAAIRVQPDKKKHIPFLARKIAWTFDSSALIVSDGLSTKSFLAVYMV